MDLGHLATWPGSKMEFSHNHVQCYSSSWRSETSEVARLSDLELICMCDTVCRETLGGTWQNWKGVWTAMAPLILE